MAKSNKQSTLNTAEIPADLIKVTGLNPRKTFEKELLEELAQSIREMGILEPLIVRQVGKAYELVSGERRLRAAKIAGLKQVPVWIREVSDTEVREIMIIENLQRESLSPLEEGIALLSMVEGGATTGDLAQRLGKSESWVRSRIGLTRVPEPIKQLLADKMLPISAALDLVPFAGTALAETVANEVMKQVPTRKEDREDHYFEQDVVKRSLDDKINREGSMLNFDTLKHNSWKEWTKKLDLAECKSCPKKVKYTTRWGETNSVCLDKDCFGPKIKDAKKKVREAAAKKEGKKSDVIDLGKVRNWKNLQRAEFDVKLCKGCKHKVIGIHYGTKETACLNRSCADAMEKKAETEAKKRLKTYTEDIKKAINVFMSDYKPAGIRRQATLAAMFAASQFDEDDLAENIKEVLGIKSRKKGMKLLEDLEDAALESAMVRLALNGLVPDSKWEYDQTNGQAVVIFPTVKYDDSPVKIEPTGYEPEGEDEDDPKPKKPAEKPESQTVHFKRHLTDEKALCGAHKSILVTHMPQSDTITCPNCKDLLRRQEQADAANDKRLQEVQDRAPESASKQPKKDHAIHYSAHGIESMILCGTNDVPKYITKESIKVTCPDCKVHLKKLGLEVTPDKKAKPVIRSCHNCKHTKRREKPGACVGHCDDKLTGWEPINKSAGELLKETPAQAAKYLKPTIYRGGSASRWECPSCRAGFTRADSQTGKSTKCKECGQECMLERGEA